MNDAADADGLGGAVRWHRVTEPQEKPIGSLVIAAALVGFLLAVGLLLLVVTHE